MPPMPFPMPLLFITAVKDICAINTFEKLLNILFSEVYCWYFGFTTLLFSATITDMSLHEVLNLFTRWPLVFRSFLHPPLVARDVVTPVRRAQLAKLGLSPLHPISFAFLSIIPFVSFILSILQFLDGSAPAQMFVHFLDKSIEYSQWFLKKRFSQLSWKSGRQLEFFVKKVSSKT